MKKSLFITAAIAFVLVTLAAKTTNAQYGCSGQYNGGCPTSQSIMIDKTVGKAGSNGTTVEYVDNLSPSDARFQGGSYIYFQLKVKNTSNVTENNVKVVDFVPAYINPVEGPGTFDQNARTITFYIPQLNANEEKVYTVKMQIVSQDQMNAGVTCQLNKASASTDNAYDDDSAQFCAEKPGTGVTGVTQVPSTGPADWIYILSGSIAALGAGIALKRKYN